MKIISQTSDEMRLGTEVFSVILTFLFAAIFLVVGIAFFSVAYTTGDVGYLQISGVLLAAGVLNLILQSYRTVIVINKKEGKISRIVKRILFSRAEEYAVRDVRSVELRRVSQVPRGTGQRGFSMPSPGGATNLWVGFILQDGTKVPIDFSVQSSGIVTTTNVAALDSLNEEGKARDLANRVAQFLDAPFQELPAS